MPRKKKIQSAGVGDTVEKILESTGIKKVIEIFVDGKDCGCEERQETLNKLFPYRFKARCLTEEEYQTYGKFREERTLTLPWKQVTYVCEFYASVFNRQVWIPDCTGCNVKTIIGMIDKLDKVFESYEQQIIKQS